MPASVRIEVSATQKRELMRIVNAKTSSQREVFRARIIWGLARGLSHQEIAEEQSESFGHWSLAEAMGGQGLGGAPRRPWTRTQAAAFA